MVDGVERLVLEPRLLGAESLTIRATRLCSTTFKVASSQQEACPVSVQWYERCEILVLLCFIVSQLDQFYIVPTAEVLVEVRVSIQSAILDYILLPACYS